MTLIEMRKEYIKSNDYFKFVGKIANEMTNNIDFYDEAFMEGDRLYQMDRHGYMNDFDTEWKELLDDAWLEYIHKTSLRLDGEQK